MDRAEHGIVHDDAVCLDGEFVSLLSKETEKSAPAWGERVTTINLQSSMNLS